MPPVRHGKVQYSERGHLHLAVWRGKYRSLFILLGLAGYEIVGILVERNQAGVFQAIGGKVFEFGGNVFEGLVESAGTWFDGYRFDERLVGKQSLIVVKAKIVKRKGELDRKYVADLVCEFARISGFDIVVNGFGRIVGKFDFVVFGYAVAVAIGAFYP